MALDLSALDGGLALDPRGGREGAVARAPLAAFSEDPDNPRFEDDPVAFETFVADVAERGILQPIVVRRLADGQLRIRFGARRYRAAQRLGLADAPYVVTDDERQFDDYAQVAENEQRAPLQPLELATFIARKLAAGEKKKTVAARLRIDASAVTHLLALAGPAPAFVLELYHARKCRSPVYLYALRRLAEHDAALVARRCIEASEIDRRFIVALTDAVNHGGEVSEGSSAGNDGVAHPSAATLASSVAQFGRSTDVDADVAPLVPIPILVYAPGEGGKATASTLPDRLRRPQLCGSHRGRTVVLDITRRPSRPDMVIVRYSDGGTSEEVALSEIALTRLEERSDLAIRK